MNRNFHPILKASGVAIAIAFTASVAGLLYLGVFQKSPHSPASAKTSSHQKPSDMSVSELQSLLELSKPAQSTQKQALVPAHRHTLAHLSSIPSGTIESNPSFPVIFILGALGLTIAGAIVVTNLLLWLGNKWFENKKLESRRLKRADEDWSDQIDQSFGSDFSNKRKRLDISAERDWILDNGDSILDLVLASASGQALLDSLSELGILTKQVAALKQEISEANSELIKQIVELEEKNLEAETPIAYLLSENHWQWNEWREQHRNQAVSLAGMTLPIKSLRYFDLSHVDLSNATLIAVDFAGADLAHADLRGANLARSSFASAKLSFADLRQANLQHSDFYCADLSYAQLDGADCNSCSMPSANLLGASLVDTTLTSTDLNNATLKSANLTQAQACFANFKSADFTGAILVRANFSHSNVYWAKFAGTNVSGTNFTSAAFSRSSQRAILKAEDDIDSNNWRYDSATNFDHTLLKKD